MKHIAPEDFVIAKPDLWLGRLILWLEKKPADEAYCWERADRCLLWQFVSQIDPSARPLVGEYLYAINGSIVDFTDFHEIAYNEPRIFGAALARARARLS